MDYMGIPLVGPRLASTVSPRVAAKEESQYQGSFVNTLKKAFYDVDAKQKNADTAMQDLAVGRKRTLHETMIAVEQADISFKMLMSVRSKVVNAYQEIMRMHF
ncbi:MAG: flagellar hook-basal body complex protein FliE [Deltaproteobacteria bacterium]|nr:flagellar hook-basal body complex protein FliE [Deltaproteobacteria bacterium]